MLVTPVDREPECGLLSTWAVSGLCLSTFYSVHSLEVETVSTGVRRVIALKGKKKEIKVQTNGH